MCSGQKDGRILDFKDPDSRMGVQLPWFFRYFCLSFGLHFMQSACHWLYAIGVELVLFQPVFCHVLLPEGSLRSALNSEPLPADRSWNDLGSKKMEIDTDSRINPPLVGVKSSKLKDGRRNSLPTRNTKALTEPLDVFQENR